MGETSRAEQSDSSSAEATGGRAPNSVKQEKPRKRRRGELRRGSQAPSALFSASWSFGGGAGQSPLALLSEWKSGVQTAKIVPPGQVRRSRRA